MSLRHFCGGNKLSAHALRSWYCEHEHLMWGPPIICCSSINCIRHKFYSKMYSFIEHSYTQTHLCKRPRSLSICLSCIPNATSSSHNATEQRKKIELREHFPLKQNQTKRTNQVPKVKQVSQIKCTIFSGVSLSKGFSLLFCSFYIQSLFRFLHWI